MMNKENINPLVSVVITNYNYENFIAESIVSVLSQTYENVKLIIIDDGSTDSSREVIRDTIKGSSGVKFVTQTNKGVVQSRNRGLDIAEGEYILFVDGDDIIPDDYIWILVEKAQAQGLDVAYTDFKRFGDEDGESNFPEFNFEKLKSQNFIHISALIRRSSMGGLRFDPHLDKLSHEDWDFYLGLAYMKIKFGKVGSVKLKYRSHGSSRNLNTENGNYIEDALRSVRAQLYILSKYNDLYPETFKVTEESELVLRWAWSHERLDMVHALEHTLKEKIQHIQSRDSEIKDRDETIRRLHGDIEDIRSSMRYRVGDILARPVGVIKKITNKGEGR